MALVFVPIVMAGCYTVPITGRQTFILIDERSELTLGLKAYEELKKETPVSTDPEITALVERVGWNIARVSDRPDFEWEFTVFDKADVQNAFCLPGGKVGIYTGILEVTENEAGLATIIAHETAHAIAKHGAERYSHGIMMALGAVLVDKAANESRNEERWKIAYGLGSTLFLALPHSRQQENEADYIGLIYMARAGYDPREAVELWRRFAAYKEEEGLKIPEFLSTHPTDETRIEHLESFLPEALEVYHQAIGQTPSPASIQPTATPALTAKIKTRDSGRDETGSLFEGVPVHPQEIILKCPYCSAMNKVTFSAGYRPGVHVRCHKCGGTFK